MPLKIAAFPKCYIDQIAGDRSMSVFDWIEMARSLDADGLEMYDGFFTSLEPSYLDRVGEAIAAAGFAMPMLCCSPDFTNPDPDARKRAVDREVELIQVARRLGGPRTVCRVLSGQRYPEISRQQGLEWVVDCINQVLPAAREHDIVLGLENHYKDGFWKYPEFAQKMDVFLELVDVDPRPRSFWCAIRPVERDRRRRRPDRVIASRRAAGRQHARQRPIAGRGDDARRPPPDRRYAGLFARPPSRCDRQGTQRLPRHLPDPRRARLSKAGSASRTA